MRGNTKFSLYDPINDTLYISIYIPCIIHSSNLTVRTINLLHHYTRTLFIHVDEPAICTKTL